MSAKDFEEQYNKEFRDKDMTTEEEKDFKRTWRI